MSTFTCYLVSQLLLKIKGLYRSAVELLANNSCLCFFPAFRSVLNLAPNVTFKPCTTMDQLVCARRLVTNEILTILYDKEALDSCPKPKITTEDTVTFRGDTSVIIPGEIRGLNI